MIVNKSNLFYKWVNCHTIQLKPSPRVVITRIKQPNWDWSSSSDTYSTHITSALDKLASDMRSTSSNKSSSHLDLNACFAILFNELKAQTIHITEISSETQQPARPFSDTHIQAPSLIWYLYIFLWPNVHTSPQFLPSTNGTSSNVNTAQRWLYSNSKISKPSNIALPSILECTLTRISNGS